MIYPNYRNQLTAAVQDLSEQFPNLAWDFRPTETDGKTELVSQWLGDPSEDIMVVCFKGNEYIEKFHRQDFFFINFVCQNGYDVLSSKYDNHLRLEEGDVYIGQPYSGYALKIDNPNEVIMVGLHIQKDLFYREYLGPLSTDTSLFHFFLDPHTNRFSDEYIRLHFGPNDVIWLQVYQMLLEYADKGEMTQAVLQPMMLTLTMYLSRVYRQTLSENTPDSSDIPLALRMISYIGEHSDHVTLSSLAEHFRYHPNYVSRYLHKETGKTFSELVLEKRMEKAKLLLSGTDLSIEKIADLLGYSGSSNFYKAFREFFHASPREFTASSRKS